MTTLVHETSNKTFRIPSNSPVKENLFYTENIVQNTLQAFVVAYLTTLTLLLWRRDVYGYGRLDAHRNVMSC